MSPRVREHAGGRGREDVGGAKRGTKAGTFQASAMLFGSSAC